MKKRHLIWIGICAAVCIAVTAFAWAAESPETKTVRNLLEKRTCVMENVLFGKITYEEGKTQLKEIERDNLYTRDLQAMLDYSDTDLEKVEGMDIVYLKKKAELYDKAVFEGKIQWTISDGDSKDYETHVYQIGVSNKGGDYKLVFFELK